MSFLQISEPEEKKYQDPNECAVGIDLGTTNSVIALFRNGKSEILGPILPSVYQGIRSIKRMMGSDIKIENMRPEEVSAKILSKLKIQAEQILGHDISKAVITVPAHFDDAARHVTKIAANIAGIEVLRLINEPTAAAVAYGLDNQAEGIYLIYDFGGGTFDVSVLRMQKGVFQVLATGGDINLGGDDIDQAIMEYLNLPSDLYHIARQAKEHLSYNEYWKSEYGSLSRVEFEQIAEKFINRTIFICEDVITQSNTDKSLIKEIVLVGGSTRIPLVKRILAEKIKKPLDSIDPDLVVAMGAAIQADALTHGSNNLLLDVTSLSIGLEIMGGMNERIIQRNSTLPISVKKQFTTHQDGQTGIIFHIVQGEREMASDCRSLAKFELKGIPPMKASFARVTVTFSVDVDGLLTVSALEENSGVKQDVVIKPSYGLSEEEIENMIEQSYINAAQDIQLKKLAEVKLATKNNITNIKQAIIEDGDLLEGKEEVMNIILHLETLLDSDNLQLIEKFNNLLEDKTFNFIQSRLNRKIKETLAGKSAKVLQDILIAKE